MSKWFKIQMVVYPTHGDGDLRADNATIPANNEDEAWKAFLNGPSGAEEDERWKYEISEAEAPQ